MGCASLENLKLHILGGSSSSTTGSSRSSGGSCRKNGNNSSCSAGSGCFVHKAPSSGKKTFFTVQTHQRRIQDIEPPQSRGSCAEQRALGCAIKCPDLLGVYQDSRHLRSAGYVVQGTGGDRPSGAIVSTLVCR